MTDSILDPTTYFVPSGAYQSLPKAPQPWVIEKLIPMGGLVNLYGKPKTGKSFLALSLAQSIVNNEPDWCGYTIAAPGPVAYLQIDTPREEWSARLAKLSIKPSPTSDLWIADMWQVPEFPFNILNPQQTELRWLKQSIASIKPVLTVIDTLREVHGGDENDSTNMRNVIAHLVDACRPSAILLLSHARKDSMLTVNGDDDMMDQARGSSYVAGRMDVVMKLTQKRLMFKGRATGQTIETIHQDEATGLIVIEPSTADQTVRTLLGDIKAALPKNASQNTIAKELAARQNISVSTAIRHIRALMPPIPIVGGTK